MSKDETLLPVEMGRLEIEPLKVSVNEENPFVPTQWKSSFFTRSLLKNVRCSCGSHRSKPDITIPIYKKKNCKLIREPKLKLLQNNTLIINEPAKAKEKSLGRRSVLSSLLPHKKVESTLYTLVNDCNQLKISSVTIQRSKNFCNDPKWWMSQCKETTSSNRDSDKSQSSPSCSQQALNPPCDITIDELASYFETLVHIPKKMSEMAEMMYI